MLKYLLAMAALLCLLSPAEARHRHHHYHHYAHHHYAHHHRYYHCAAVQPAWFCLLEEISKSAAPELQRGEPQPVRYVGRSHWTATRPTVAQQTISYGSFDYAVSRPARFIAGSLKCAINVGAALAERGIRGTGSAAALSYLHWGRSAGGPVPGAVIVSSRQGGGHVALVSRVVNGVTYAWNTPGGSRGWQEIPYHRPVIDYRIPG